MKEINYFRQVKGSYVNDNKIYIYNKRGEDLFNLKKYEGVWLVFNCGDENYHDYFELHDDEVAEFLKTYLKRNKYAFINVF